MSSEKEEEGSGASDYGLSDLESLEQKETGSEPFEQSDLIKEMRRLRDSMQHLITIFERAGKMLEEEDDSKHDQILSQNKRIANGIIGLADRIKGLEEKLDNKDSFHAPPPKRPAPPSGNGDEHDGGKKKKEDVPEPPEKKGFFSKFKK